MVHQPVPKINKLMIDSFLPEPSTTFPMEVVEDWVDNDQIETTL